MPHFTSELAAAGSAYPYKWILTLDDGSVFRIYNRVKRDGRWCEVDAADASRRVFVSRSKERFVYVFGRGEDRSMTARAGQLERQLEIARTRTAKHPRASIEWSGNKCYFTTAEGRVYRVHDGWYKNKRHVNVKPGTGFPPSRWFVPADKTDWIRVFHFQNHDERDVSAAALEQQLTRTHFLAGKQRPDVGASDWKTALRADQLR